MHPFFLRSHVRPVSVMTVLALALVGCASDPKPPEKKNLSPEQITQQRQAIDDVAQAAMTRLYQEYPEAQAKVEQAAGYGVFSVGMVNAVLLVEATGNGVIVDQKNGQRTYMQEARAGTGPGLGYQRLTQVFIFKSESALNQFKINDAAGADISASATLGTSNHGMSFSPNIEAYQMNEKGFALQANWGGTAYFVDPDLN
ncbi:hypothetical protein [Ottowia sp.]|uniref:hypothetical protein n=1 Tax=Ottowia sp. TaxID=1898956 RepID=UPI003A875CE8